MRIIYLILFVGFLSVFVPAQTDKGTAQKLDDYFTSLADEREIKAACLSPKTARSFTNAKIKK